MIKLSNRTLIQINGPDAQDFLQDLITVNMTKVEAGVPAFGALLSPGGKILFEFFIFQYDDGYLVDLLSDQAGDFIKKLTLYKMRRDVEIKQVEEGGVFVAINDQTVSSDHGTTINDPRHEAMGQRIYITDVFKPELSGDISTYHSHRIALGLPELGQDYNADEVFPHEALYDQFGGVDFKKGCYIGQEVVSRMHHKAKPKSRFIKIEFKSDAKAQMGDEIRAGDQLIGTLGSIAGNKALALIRLDRAKKAMEEGVPLQAGGAELELHLPDWVDFTWPEQA